ncbi:hypothetical protein JKP88DRAFT_282474 [Tribonema minus]|uniref:Uncharacterized protein n=1 Tax=Tribonema minus TaxID=303371 RepID=A0A835YNM6_9STRA|nr:hypothetical protein JKP88DRAFT_282474 [Tribonema minus]
MAASGAQLQWVRRRIIGVARDCDRCFAADAWGSAHLIEGRRAKAEWMECRKHQFQRLSVLKDGCQQEEEEGTRPAGGEAVLFQQQQRQLQQSSRVARATPRLPAPAAAAAAAEALLQWIDAHASPMLAGSSSSTGGCSISGRMGGGHASSSAGSGGGTPRRACIASGDHRSTTELRAAANENPTSASASAQKHCSPPPTPTATSLPDAVVRVILLYGRSAAVPRVQPAEERPPLLSHPRLYLDALYVHAHPNEEVEGQPNDCQGAYDALHAAISDSRATFSAVTFTRTLTAAAAAAAGGERGASQPPQARPAGEGSPQWRSSTRPPAERMQQQQE